MARKDPISHLGRSSTPSDALVREVVALGMPAVPRLCAMATNRAGWAPEETYENRAARSAIFVLRRLRDPAAVPALVEVLTEAPVDSRVVRSAAWALPGFGAAIVEPLLPHAREGARWIEATEALAECGVRDERILERVLALLDAAPMVGADAARSYGDPELIPVLQATFDAALPAGDPTGDEVGLLIELVKVILELGEADHGRMRRLQMGMARFKDAVERKKALLADMQATMDGLGAAGVAANRREATLNRVAARLLREGE